MSKPNQIKSFMAVLRTNKPLKLLLMAIGLAILAAFLAVKYLQLREAALKDAYQRSGERMVSVIVARGNLQRGTVLNKANLAVRKIPSIYVHQQVVPPGKFSVIKGRRLLEPLSQGRALLWSHVTGDQRRDFSDVLVSGRRAVTIPVDTLSSISGMVEPGNHVDLHITLPATLVGGGDGDVVFPLLQNVEVLATGRRLEPKVQATMAVSYRNKGRGYSTLTVNLSAKETTLLFAANTAGRLSAALRNRSDGGFVFTRVHPSEILSLAQSFAEEARVKAQGKVKVVRDKDGNIIGRVNADGQVINEKGEVIGKVNSDGTVVSNTGEIIGTAAEEPVLTEKVVRDKNGNIIGKIVNGQVVNEKGEVIGKVNDDGTVVGNDGKSLGTVSEHIVSDVEVVRDKEGNIIGRVVNGQVVDANGNVIGKVNADGSVVGLDGKFLGTVSKEAVTAELARQLGTSTPGSASGGATSTWLVDYLVGGNSKNGVAVVTKVPIK